MKKLLFIMVAMLTTAAYGQEKVSARSNAIQLELNGIVPTITWISPQTYETNLTEKQFTVKVGVKSQGKLKSAELYLNDALVGQSRGFKPATGTGYDKLIERDVVLSEGDNILKVVAVSMDEVEVSDIRVLRVEGTATAMLADRTDYALLFGTDEYDEWSDLFNPVKDAQTIAQELEENYGFKTEVVLNATTGEMMAKLREYAKKSYQPNDQLFIFFAGHGQFDEIFTEGYLVGKDSKLNDPGKTSYISHSTLRTVINNIPCNHILLTLDACFGGTFDPLVARSGSRGQDDIYADITRSEFIQRRLRFKTRKYITSGGKQYVADGKPGGHSPFARKFLQALRDYGGQDRILTLQELQGYLLTLRMEPHAGEFGDNEPGSDFVFVAR
ncbi:MAG TPA: caspase family protein [Flammeovirgaceae bacterium]|nr:caspase family protein [Flammeovirgaceae bacterium]